MNHRSVVQPTHAQPSEKGQLEDSFWGPDLVESSSSSNSFMEVLAAENQLYQQPDGACWFSPSSSSIGASPSPSSSSSSYALVNHNALLRRLPDSVHMRSTMDGPLPATPGRNKVRVDQSYQQQQQLQPCHDWYVLNPHDRSILMDHHNYPVTIDRILATRPLKSELATRPGPGGRKLIYMAGESVTRTLNDIFGFDGWNLEIIRTEQTSCTSSSTSSLSSQQQQSKPTGNNNNNQNNSSKNNIATSSASTTTTASTNSNTRWQVAYIAHVRITHKRSGTFKEDIGAGDAIDKHLPTAVQHALKASITDALKRAARHFGDKLGNSLYQGTFSMQNAPKTLQEALDQYDRERTKTKFGAISSSMMATPMNSTFVPMKPEDKAPTSSCATPVSMNNNLNKPAATSNANNSMPPPPPKYVSQSSTKPTSLYAVGSANVDAASNTPIRPVTTSTTATHLPILADESCASFFTTNSNDFSLVTSHTRPTLVIPPPPTAAQGLQSMFRGEPPYHHDNVLTNGITTMPVVMPIVVGSITSDQNAHSIMPLPEQQRQQQRPTSSLGRKRPILLSANGVNHHRHNDDTSGTNRSVAVEGENGTCSTTTVLPMTKLLKSSNSTTTITTAAPAPAAVSVNPYQHMTK